MIDLIKSVKGFGRAETIFVYLLDHLRVVL